MSDAFDPAVFMQTSVEGKTETSYVPVPEGEYRGIIVDAKPRLTRGDYVVLDIRWELDDESLREETGMNEVTVRQSIFLDMDDSGTLAMGKNKNVKLGRLREALNQNSGVWNPSMLIGAGPALLKVEQRQMDDGSIFAEVTRTAPLQ